MARTTKVSISVVLSLAAAAVMVALSGGLASCDRGASLSAPRPTTAPVGSTAAHAQVATVTEHYEIIAPPGLVPDAVAILEQFYPVLAEHFGPLKYHEGRLRVEVISDTGAFADVLKQRWPEWSLRRSAGFYDPSSRTAYVLGLDDAASIYNRILHECTHQYHHLARRGGRGRWGEAVYAEGIAVHFSSYEWEGGRLHVGLLRTRWTRDRAGEAIDHFHRLREGNLARANWRNGSPNHSDAWALVTFLKDYDRERFMRWTDGLDAGHDGQHVFEDVYGDALADVNEAYARWLEGIRLW